MLAVSRSLLQRSSFFLCVCLCQERKEVRFAEAQRAHAVHALTWKLNKTLGAAERSSLFV